MTDDSHKQAADRKRISLSEHYEVEYWTKKWGVSREKLTAAVDNVGHMVDDVRHELGKSE